MSRSRKRQPFQAITGRGSAKRDKQLAAQGVRRAFRHALHTTIDFEDFLSPHRYECAWNETYSWGRDGRQMYQGFSRMRYSWQRHQIAIGAIEPRYRFEQDYVGDPEYTSWPPAWYAQMLRK